MARFATVVDGHRSTRRRSHLHAVFLTAETVGHVPVGRGLVRNVGTTLDILRADLLAATDAVTDESTGHRSAGRGHILTASTADLVTEDAANDCAGNRGGIVVAALLDEFLTLDPATLFRWAKHGMDGNDISFVQALVVASPIVVAFLTPFGWRRCIATVVDAGIPTYLAY